MVKLRFHIQNTQNPERRANANEFQELMADPRIAIKLSTIRASGKIFEEYLSAADGIIFSSIRLYLGKASINLVANMVADINMLYQETISLLADIWKVARENMEKYPPGMEDQVKDNLKDVDLFIGNLKSYLDRTLERLETTSLNKNDLIKALEKKNPLSVFGELLK